MLVSTERHSEEEEVMMEFMNTLRTRKRSRYFTKELQNDKEG